MVKAKILLLITLFAAMPSMHAGGNTSRPLTAESKKIESHELSLLERLPQDLLNLIASFLKKDFDNRSKKSFERDVLKKSGTRIKNTDLRFLSGGCSLQSSVALHNGRLFEFITEGDSLLEKIHFSVGSSWWFLGKNDAYEVPISKEMQLYWGYQPIYCAVSEDTKWSAIAFRTSNDGAQKIMVVHCDENDKKEVVVYPVSFKMFEKNGAIDATQKEKLIALYFNEEMNKLGVLAHKNSCARNDESHDQHEFQAIDFQEKFKKRQQPFTLQRYFRGLPVSKSLWEKGK